MIKNNDKHTLSKGPLLFILPYFRKYFARISIGLAALLCVDFLQLSIPRVIKSAIDGLANDGFSNKNLINHALIIFAIALGVAFFRFLWRYLILGFSRLLEEEIRNALVKKLITLDRAYFQKRTTGSLMALATNDLASVQLACGMGLVSFVDAVVMTFAVIGFMLYISPLLTLISLATLPILAILTRKLSGKLHNRFKLVQEQFSKLTEVARSTISSMRLIKVYTQEERQINRFNDLGLTYIDHNLKVAKIQGVLFPVSGLIANVSLLMIVLIGGKMAINHTITLGDFVAFISYLLMMTWPMMAIGWVANLFQRGMTSLGRIQKVLNDEPLLTNAPNPRPVPIEINSLAVSIKKFTYPNQNTPVLQNINLKFQRGLYGIVGKTGCGKTTFCSLLARMYPVEDNTLFLNEVDINQFDIHAYRNSIAYVPQEPLLFSDTITNNIAFGVPNATQSQVESVAMQAGIHEEILTFSKGYQTRIGEKGVKLSGGQRQRISLARALLVDAPILILDDGLSAVDSDTEQHILKTLNSVAQKATVIIVSHRLSPLTDSKSITVFDDGSISAVGSHNYLMEHSPYYKIIYESQADNGS